MTIAENSSNIEKDDSLDLVYISENMILQLMFWT